MVTQVDFLSQTFAKITGGMVGTAPDFFVASSDQTAAVITTAGAIADMRASGLVKTYDIIWVNGDMDGTPFQNVYTVTDTSGGSLTPYTEAVGGVLLASNNLSDVDSVSTARTNLGLGEGSQVEFTQLYLGNENGVAGNLGIFSDTALKGAIQITCTDNDAQYIVHITNEAHGQSTLYTIPDAGAAVGSFLVCPLAIADVNANIVAFDVICGQAALASAGSVILVDSSGSKQYKVLELFINSGGTNFSGGGGDRLGQVTDGTTVYSVVPAASLQTLANARWGSTAMPFPASSAINTSTAAGADLVFKYSGGTTDYTAGSVVISGFVKRVA